MYLVTIRGSLAVPLEMQAQINLRNLLPESNPMSISKVTLVLSVFTLAIVLGSVQTSFGQHAPYPALIDSEKRVIGSGDDPVSDQLETQRNKIRQSYFETDANGVLWLVTRTEWTRNGRPHSDLTKSRATRNGPPTNRPVVGPGWSFQPPTFLRVTKAPTRNRITAKDWQRWRSNPGNGSLWFPVTSDRNFQSGILGLAYPNNNRDRE